MYLELFQKFDFNIDLKKYSYSIPQEKVTNIKHAIMSIIYKLSYSTAR